MEFKQFPGFRSTKKYLIRDMCAFYIMVGWCSFWGQKVDAIGLEVLAKTLTLLLTAYNILRQRTLFKITLPGQYYSVGLLNNFTTSCTA